MPGTYKLITLVGTSSNSFAQAADSAIEEASHTVRGITWFEVDDLRGRVEDGRVTEYQVTLRAGFRVDRDPVARPKPAKRKKRR